MRSKPLARLPELWLELARHVGLIERDPAGERLLAASSEFWTDNAVHLPQMIATGWMGLQSWQELEATICRRECRGARHCRFSALRYCSYSRHWAKTSGPPWTIWRVSSRSAGPIGTGCRSRNSLIRLLPLRAAA